MSVSRFLPRATYRLQLRSGVGFAQVAELADYLAALGISHVYLSPCQTAAPGSTHGYDIADPGTLDSSLGGPEGYAALCRALREHGLRLVLDIVPNHMSTALPWNAAWWSVLERGRASRHAHWFDVDWDAPGAGGKVVLAILGEPVEALLARGAIRVRREGGRMVLQAQDHRLPLDPETLPRDPPGTDPEQLRTLLERQHFSLVPFRAGRRRLNYRRFFDIDGLIGLRMEDERVFEETHGALLALLEDGTVEGLRVDHPDGMRDPEGYFRRLRRAAPRAWIVAEKILAREEELPRSWPVDGTTGYDFLERVGGLFVDPRGEAALTALQAEFTGMRTEFSALARAKKRLVLRELFAGEVERLVAVLATLGERAGLVEPPRSCWKDALERVIVALPVYRTYVRAGEPASESERRVLGLALRAAREESPELEVQLGFLEELFSGRVSGALADEALARFQQLSGPATAKGIEDTAFYCDQRLISLCEVGGDPARFGGSVAEFHAACARTQQDWPATMTTTATHDTKRSLDVRVRVALLSEIPAAWSQAVQAWAAGCERHCTDGLPERAMQYQLFQTLVGAWPLSAERLLAFATKAAREAKLHTSWLEPSQAYEEPLARFVHGILGDAWLVGELESFLAPLLPAARTHSLSQTLLQLCAPGVPDVYQGSELQDHSLADPDNRRPVDFALRRRLLAELAHLTPAQILARSDEGLPRLHLIHRTLTLRRERAASFAPRTGAYTPLAVRGPGAERVVAFLRGADVLVVAPRLVLGSGSWDETTLALPPGTWSNRLAPDSTAQGTLALAPLFGRFPVGLLARE